MTHTPPTDRQLLDKLKRLIDSAAAKVERWEAQNPEATEEDREKYRDWCHRQVWGKYLEVSSKLTLTVSDYNTTGGGSYEEEMHAFYDAYNAAWEDDKWLSDDTEWLTAITEEVDDGD